MRVRSTLAGLSLAAVAVAALAMPPGRGRSTCDPGDLLATVAAIEATCACTEAVNHGQFVRCANQVIRAALEDGTLARECMRLLKRGIARSTCGKPEGFVTCCRPRGNSFKPAACSVERSEDRCEARPGRCVGTSPSCLDACDTGCGSPSGAFVDGAALP